MHYDRLIGFGVAMLFWGEAVLAANECPQSAAEWTEWRARTVADTTPSSLGKLKPFFERCGSAPACINPLRDVATALSSLDKEHLPDGRPVGNYFDNAPKLESTPFADPEFQKAMENFDEKSRGIRDRLLKIQEKNPGMEIVEKGNHFLIMMPGEKVDRWFNIEPGLMLGLDVVHGKPPKMRFNVFRSISKREGKEVRVPIHGGQAWQLEEGLRRPAHCARCHQPSGAIGVLKETDTTADLLSLDPKKNAAPMAARMNERIEATASAVPDGFSMENFGPPMGRIDPRERTIDWLRKCANVDKRALSDEKLELVRDAMNCASCHNGRKAGVIRAPLGGDGFAGNLFKAVIHSGHMPPNHGLDKETREATAACLSKEYYGGFKGFGEGGEPGVLAKHVLGRACNETAPAPREVPRGNGSPHRTH